MSPRRRGRPPFRPADLSRPLLYDGAKGVYLSAALPAAGRSPADASEWLNVLAPSVVIGMHREYVGAGSQMVQTNSFNGNRLRLTDYGLGDRVREVNLAAARLARNAAGDGVWVAGVLGPSGKLLVMGEVEEAVLVDAFAEQAAALAEGGVDLFHIETMSDLGEARAAVAGVRRVSDLPLLLTMSFDSGRPEALRTMMGVSPAELAQAAAEMDVSGVGANCGRGPEGYQEVLGALARAEPPALLVAKLNAGLPRTEGTRVAYDTTPADMAAYARWCAGHGVGIIGGCCGTTPGHIEAMARALESATYGSEAVAERPQTC